VVKTNPAISITKNPKEQTVVAPGTATWTIVVKNTGDVTLTNVHVNDPQARGCNRTKAQIAKLASMAPGATVTYTCSRKRVTQEFTNVATAIGTPPTGPNVTDSDSAHVGLRTVAHFAPPPLISITKNPKSQTVAQGDPATWTITVKNTGQVKLHDVTVTDAKAPNCDRDLGMLNVNQSKDYTCSRPDTQEDFTNTAVVVGTSPTNQKVTANDSAVVNFVPVKKAEKPKPVLKPPVISHEKPKNTG
jgi:uncharacterized repeat protein (TIGR01451 family)